MKKLIVSLIILVILILGVVLIFNNKNTKIMYQEEKINIVTSIYPIYDFAKEVGGEKVNVNMLLSPGVEIHDFEPTPQDIVNIQEADLFLYTGEKLEPWAETVISGIDSTENIKNVAFNIELVENEEEEEHSSAHEEHEKYDTHIWLDPQKSIQIVENIRDELCIKDPENSLYYQENAIEYISKLTELDNDIKKVVNDAENKEIAFGGPFAYTYFIRRYNLNYISAYDSCGEDSEPSVDKIFTVINEMKNKNIPVIFYKELSSGNTINTIASETGAEKLQFHSLHSISQRELESGETYLSIMYQNLENLKKALK
ncbi:MAG: zinc ABC transporter substrate-binding protein [Clostridia bacterium]|nr:zinc ABC transporter substrate-binding protein [Clostridia bacterium]